MVFKRKAGFFLDLGSEGSQPATIAVAAPKPEAPKPEAPQAEAAKPAAPKPAPAAAPVLTTAEAIAAELRAAQEAKPPVSSVTFAPTCLNPANAVPSRRRRAGANLAGFKAMAKGLFSS
jgi:hypothetical protein